MVARYALGLAIAIAVIAAQPGLTAPVADSHALAMSGRLFPAIEALKVDGLSSDARRMLEARRARVQACPRQDAPCVVEKSLWIDSEISLIAEAGAKALAANDNAVVNPDDGARAQLKRELAGLNSVLQVYGLGRPPRNPKLDGPLDKAGETPFLNRVSAAVAINQLDPGPALDASIGLAVSLLDANDQTQAIAFEPLDEKYNAAAKAYARTVDWSRYQYTAIIVLGNGPELDNEALSPRGKLRVKLAAGRFADKSAPFIIVSGGAVHPRGTKISEAVEMRKALMERYGVPEAAIILEPYARYTSTNLRNATRRLSALGAPLTRKAIALTDEDHSKYVESPQFKARSISELGYFSGELGPRISPAELAFYPSASALRVDPLDPLDP